MGKGIALVTGAAGDGIGKATAQRLAADGFHVAVTDVHLGRIDATVDEIRAAGGRADGFELDVSAEDLVPRIDAIRDEIGPIDVLVNNAALNVAGSPAAADFADWDAVVHANLRGPVMLTAAVLPSMVSRARGSIIMVSTVAAWTSGSYGGAYAPSKAALHSFLLGVAAKGGPAGVRCNGVAPGIIRSRWVDAHPERYVAEAAATPLRRFGEPSEVAAVIAWLVSDDASFVTGEIINVSGGWFMRP